MIENLRIGAPVYTSYGARAGVLERIVVSSADPQGRGERRVTSLVVDPGFRDLSELLSPGSVEKPRARTVPVELVTSADEEGVRLSCNAEEFEALPLFERREYVAAPVEQEGRRFRWGDIINYAAAAFGLGSAPYMPSTEATAFNEAAGSAALPARASVWREKPHEEIGHIERTLVDSETDRVVGFALRLKRQDEMQVLLPVEAITSIEDGVAHVSLTDEELDQLASFED
jgi:hypothetical protein